jgi:hypothetical protein
MFAVDNKRVRLDEDVHVLEECGNAHPHASPGSPWAQAAAQLRGGGHGEFALAEAHRACESHGDFAGGMNFADDIVQPLLDFLAFVDENNRNTSLYARELKEEGTRQMKMKQISRRRANHVTTKLARMSAPAAGGVVRPPLGMRACRRCGRFSETITQVPVPPLEEKIVWWCATCEEAEPEAFECVEEVQAAHDKLKIANTIANKIAGARLWQIKDMEAQVKNVIQVIRDTSDTYT